MRRWIPLGIILFIFVLFFLTGWYRYFSFSTLSKHHAAIQAWMQSHQVVAIGCFILLYIVVTTASIPGAVFVTLLGGFLFGIVLGSVLVVVGATVGATCIFLAVKYAFADQLSNRLSGWLLRLEKGFQENAFNYLLFLRLVPLFPFWVVNVIPGILNMRAWSYVLATVIGIMPGVVVYTAVGNGLSAVFETGGTPELDIIFKPVILVPMISLGLLSLVPILYQYFKKKSK